MFYFMFKHNFGMQPTHSLINSWHGEMLYVQNISCFSLSPFGTQPLISSCSVFGLSLCQTSVPPLSSPGPSVLRVGGVGQLSSRPRSHRLSQGFNPGVVTRKGRITPREDTNSMNSKLLAWYRVQNYEVGAYDNHSWDLLWEFQKYQLRCSLSMYHAVAIISSEGLDISWGDKHC